MGRRIILEYDCFFDVPEQPDLSSDHPGVRDYFITNACQWLREGCDCFRLDYAKTCGRQPRTTTDNFGFVGSNTVLGCRATPRPISLYLHI
jgi:glycosidase